MRFLNAVDFSTAQAWLLLVWCREAGADEITFRFRGLQGYSTPFTDQAEAVLAPFRLASVSRPHMHVYEGEEDPRLTDVWTLTEESIAVLQDIFHELGLFTYPVGEWEIGCIEDPIVYRNGQILLGIVSHEGEGILYVTEHEATLLEARGIPSRDEPDWIKAP